MTVTITDHTPTLLAKLKTNGALAIKRALDDVKRLSKSKTPYSGGRVLASGKTSVSKGGHLRDSVLTQVLGLGGKVSWNKEYAQYQERGMRRSGTHVVKKYTTGGTGKKFAEDTVKKVDGDKAKYLKGLLTR